MKWLLSFSVLVALAATAQAQEFVQDIRVAPPDVTTTSPAVIDFGIPSRNSSDFLKGNRSFPNFIGFLSNPIQSIEPRATTEIVAMFGAGWVSGNSPYLPSGNMQVYGGGPYSIALSERLSAGINQGGYAVANFSSDRQQILRNLGLPVPNRDLGGQREGWLNLGGFVQYTLIADVPNQFLVTAGMRWEAPSGTTQIFQGSGPPYLAPYLTVGKEFGCWHILATTGFEFPVTPGDVTTKTFYANVHIDRKIGWLYPLVEFNGSYHTTNVNLNLTPNHDVIDLGTFSSTGNTLTVAAGANAVLVPDGSNLARFTFGLSCPRAISKPMACW
jgi:hypothetical protein